jgi:hypothetical protein
MRETTNEEKEERGGGVEGGKPYQVINVKTFLHVPQ